MSVQIGGPAVAPDSLQGTDTMVLRFCRPRVGPKGIWEAHARMFVRGNMSLSSSKWESRWTLAGGPSWCRISNANGQLEATEATNDFRPTPDACQLPVVRGYTDRGKRGRLKQ